MALAVTLMMKYGKTVSKFDLTFSFIEYQNQLRLEIEYNVDLYRSAFIEELSDNLQHFLSKCIDEAERKISAIEYISTQQQDKVVRQFNGTATRYQSEKNVVAAFREQALKSAQETAIICQNESVTYAQLEERSNKLGSYLQSLGIGAGTVVGICLDRSIDTIVGMLGILKSGAAYLPLDPFYPLDRIDHIIEHSQAQYVLVNEQTRYLLFRASSLH